MSGVFDGFKPERVYRFFEEVARVPRNSFHEQKISDWLVNFARERGIACVLTIEGAVDLFDPARLTFRPLTPELSFTSVLAWKKLSPYSGAAGKYLEYIKSIHPGHTDV